MIHRYRWIRTEALGRCRCGGIVWEYRVQPRRSDFYLNVVGVCDGEDCREMAVHAGTDRERRGRLILS